MKSGSLDIGGGTMLPLSEVLCILPWTNALLSPANRDLISSLRARGKMKTVGNEPHRSLVICDHGIYASFLSPATLLLRIRRLSGNVFLFGLRSDVLTFQGWLEEYGKNSRRGERVQRQ